MGDITARVGKLYIDHNGTKHISSAFAIREGAVITAAHAFPDLNNKAEYKNNNNDYIEWSTTEGGETVNAGDQQTEVTAKNKSQSLIEKVLYYKEKGIAIFACKTPVNINFVSVLSRKINSREEFDAYGYPHYNNYQFSTLTGHTKSPKNEHSNVELNFNENIPDEEWIKGFSGGPAFLLEQHKPQYLIGVVIRTSDSYIFGEGEVKRKEIKPRNGVLIVAPISPLLKDPEDLEFHLAFFGEEQATYQEKQKEELQRHWKKMPAAQKEFKEFEALISKNKDYTEWVDYLVEIIPDNLTIQEVNEWEKLLSLLLTQIDNLPQVSSAKNSIHKLNVSTAVLSEISLAQEYEIDPKFILSPTKSYIPQWQGADSLPLSIVETGFNNRAAAKESARVILHAIYRHLKGNSLNDNGDEATIFQGLDSLLESLVKRKKNLIRLEINESINEHQNYSLIVKQTRNDLNNILPHLLITYYGSQQAFDEEEGLNHAIGNYMNKLTENTTK